MHRPGPHQRFICTDKYQPVPHGQGRSRSTAAPTAGGAQAVSASGKPHGSACPPCTASHKLREVIHRRDQALPLARLVGGRGLDRGLCWSLGMTRRVRLHQGQAGARVVGFLTDLGEGGSSAPSPEGVAHAPQAGHSTSVEHPPWPSSYPLAQPLDVAEPGDPLRGVDVGGVGAAMVHLRGHLGWGGEGGTVSPAWGHLRA